MEFLSVSESEHEALAELRRGGLRAEGGRELIDRRERGLAGPARGRWTPGLIEDLGATGEPEVAPRLLREQDI
ncbi:MAG: hypothetical protein H0X17_02485, partial [Deltaproteobacteria bacterium]|nr:hypothetical protein [Deltaproteobacteria bacterium]